MVIARQGWLCVSGEDGPGCNRWCLSGEGGGDTGRRQERWLVTCRMETARGRMVPKTWRRCGGSDVQMGQMEKGHSSLKLNFIFEHSLVG